ncbi:MAG: hypothetical protein BM564_07725 [Bacteroidetes bacterium MedPE-SWsnd-G2]|nr:MAG: hypothetical protein BM564_07725 [Bacteroidetes bacterium MedPE-SWsnd-G2]
MNVNHIVTPLDSAVLDSKEQYVFYHKMVDFVLKQLNLKMEALEICSAQEITFFKQYCDLILYSIEAMRIKYMYDEEEDMKIDLTESGFPNYLEFRYLFNDLALRENYLNRLTDVNALKEEFLDILLRQKKSIPRPKLYQASSIIYYTSVEQKYIFNRFVQGKVVKSEDASQGEYLVSWSFFDVALNRPFVCYLYFDYDGKNVDDCKTQLYDVLKQSADRKMALDTMAYGIDRKLTKLEPKRIKRIDLGPIHNVFAKDENVITHQLLKSILNKEVPLESFAVSMSIDEVASTDTFKEGGFFSGQILQKWGEVNKKPLVFAPHRMIQLLYNKCPEALNKLAKPPFEIPRLNIEKLKTI